MDSYYNSGTIQSLETIKNLILKQLPNVFNEENEFLYLLENPKYLKDIYNLSISTFKIKLLLSIQQQG